MAQMTRALIFQRIQDSPIASTQQLTTICNSNPGNLTPASDFQGQQACKWCININAS